MTTETPSEEDLRQLSEAQTRLDEGREAAGIKLADPVRVSDLAMGRVKRINPLVAMEKAKAKRRLADSDVEKESRIRESLDALCAKLGKRYAGCDLDTFVTRNAIQMEILDAVRCHCDAMSREIESGKNVLLFGPRGTGKDHLATCILKATVRAGYSASWINGLDWFGVLRDGIDKGSSEVVELSRLTKPTVLCISDPLPLFGDLSQFQAGQLWRVIDRRYRDMKPTIVTLNVANRQEAEQRMGASLVDRLAHGALTLFCNWESYRKPSN